MANQENRTVEIVNQKLLFESGTEVVGVAGKTAYILQSQTSDEVHYNQSLHEGSGLSRQYAEKTLQVECYKIQVHHGNYAVNADRGAVLIKGKTICLEAEDITLKAKNTITIGNKNRTTDQINLNARKIQVSRNNGNLGDWMKISDKYKGFASSFVSNSLGNIGASAMGGTSLSSLAKTAATAYGGPVAGIAAETLVNELQN
mgnify:CR=1 FL=1